MTFDINFWTLLIFALTFALNIYGINAARGRASAEQLERSHATLRKEIEELRERSTDTHIRFGERIQALETQLKNSITDQDLVAVHRRVDELHTILAGIGKSLARVEGIMEGWTSKHPREN